MFVFPSRLLKFVSAAVAFVMLLGVLLLPAPAVDAGMYGDITNAYHRRNGCTIYVVYQAYAPIGGGWPQQYQVRIWGGSSTAPLSTFVVTGPGQYTVAVPITQLYPNGGTITVGDGPNYLAYYDLDTAMSLANRRRCAALQP